MIYKVKAMKFEVYTCGSQIWARTRVMAWVKNTDCWVTPSVFVIYKAQDTEISQVRMMLKFSGFHFENLISVLCKTYLKSYNKYIFFAHLKTVTFITRDADYISHKADSILS